MVRTCNSKCATGNGNLPWIISQSRPLPPTTKGVDLWDFKIRLCSTPSQFDYILAHVFITLPEAQFRSVKIVFKRSEKPICAPSRLSEVPPMLPLKQFQCPSDWRWPSLVLSRIKEGRWALNSSFHESLSSRRSMAWRPWLNLCTQVQTLSSAYGNETHSSARGNQSDPASLLYLQLLSSIFLFVIAYGYWFVLPVYLL